MLKTSHSCGGRSTTAVPKPTNDDVPLLIPSLPPYAHEAHRRPSAAIAPPFMATAIAATSSWLRNRRIRYLVLLLCSPLLLLLFCAALPFLCAAELCLRRRIWGKLVSNDEQLRRCEEGCCCECGGDEEKGLLHRYLEDQLLLLGSMYECGEEELDIENIGNIRTPLFV